MIVGAHEWSSLTRRSRTSLLELGRSCDTWLQGALRSGGMTRWKALRALKREINLQTGQLVDVGRAIKVYQASYSYPESFAALGRAAQEKLADLCELEDDCWELPASIAYEARDLCDAAAAGTIGYRELVRALRGLTGAGPDRDPPPNRGAAALALSMLRGQRPKLVAFEAFGSGLAPDESEAILTGMRRAA